LCIARRTAGWRLERNLSVKLHLLLNISPEFTKKADLYQVPKAEVQVQVQVAITHDQVQPTDWVVTTGAQIGRLIEFYGMKTAKVTKRWWWWYGGACYLLNSREHNLRIRRSRRRKQPSNAGSLYSLINSKPYQKSAPHFSCLATLQQTPKSHKICHIAAWKVYTITSCCLLVLDDKLKKTA